MIDPDMPCFLRVPVSLIPVVLKALEDAGAKEAAQEVRKFTAQYTDPSRNLEREWWLSLAREKREINGDIEFDNDAAISESRFNGEYVLGWVSVPKEEDDNAPEE